MHQTLESLQMRSSSQILDQIVVPFFSICTALEILYQEMKLQTVDSKYKSTFHDSFHYSGVEKFTIENIREREEACIYVNF